jgi:hypothetical protein
VRLRKSERPSHFEMTFNAGNKSYFMSGSPKGMIAGPKIPGKNDHLTVGSEGDEIIQIHRTINDREDWRLTNESLQAEVDSFLANNTSTLDATSIHEDSYLVSLDRLNLAFTIFQSILSIPLSLVIRLVATQYFVKKEDGIQMTVAIEPDKLVHLVEKARIPLAILSPFIQRLASAIVPKLAKKVGRSFLVAPGKLVNSDDGILLIISKNRIGVLWRDENLQLRFIPMTAIFEAYSRIERNQPFGKINEIVGTNSQVSITARSWT